MLDLATTGSMSPFSPREGEKVPTADEGLFTYVTRPETQNCCPIQKLERMPASMLRRS
jgi:hypothetical protein